MRNKSQKGRRNLCYCFSSSVHSCGVPFWNRRKAGKISNPLVCSMGCLWNSADYSLGLLAARRSDSWIYDSSHFSHVCHVRCGLLLLFNESARTAHTWIGRHFWSFTSVVACIDILCLVVLASNWSEICPVPIETRMRGGWSNKQRYYTGGWSQRIGHHILAHLN